MNIRKKELLNSVLKEADKETQDLLKQKEPELYKFLFSIGDLPFIKEIKYMPSGRIVLHTLNSDMNTEDLKKYINAGLTKIEVDQNTKRINYWFKNK